MGMLLRSALGTSMAKSRVCDRDCVLPRVGSVCDCNCVCVVGTLTYEVDNTFAATAAVVAAPTTAPPTMTVIPSGLSKNAAIADGVDLSSPTNTVASTPEDEEECDAVDEEEEAPTNTVASTPEDEEECDAEDEEEESDAVFAVELLSMPVLEGCGMLIHASVLHGMV